MDQINKKIRFIARVAGIPLWAIARELGITDSHFSRKLRSEFSEDETRKIVLIIKKLERGET